jgi:hypothetical protein
MDFGYVVVSDTLWDTLYVKNIGLTNLDVTGAPPCRHVLEARPFTVLPGDSQLVSLRFVPPPRWLPGYVEDPQQRSKKPTFKVPISAGGSDPVYFSTGTLTFSAT